MVALSPNAHRVLEARYLRRDGAGRVVESPEELCARVARAIAHAELLLGDARAAAHWEEVFRGLLAALDFLPNSPVLMNAGTPAAQLAACFVLPLGDTLESIFDALRAMALVQRTGGGTGFAFSRLRPRGAALHATGGESTGPVSFLRVFDCATEQIRLGGRRRGANMAVLRADHPDVCEFIEAKCDGPALRNFNLAVAVTDDFMEAASTGADYDLVNPGTGDVAGRTSAAGVFDRIVRAAWRTGDPGLLFLDAVNRANPTPALGPIETTNPCGEVPLLPWESCVLGSVNLANMVCAGGADLDWARLRHAVAAGVRFLDDVVEVSCAPLPEIAGATRATRKIGLGVMGFAEMLIGLGVSYAEAGAIDWADRVMAVVAEEARETSRRLAAERGVFPAWPHSVHGTRGEPRRNATCLSIAPTGTLAIVAGTSGGIEPLFALAYRRAHTLGGAPLVEENPVFARAVASLGREDLLRQVREHGTLAGAAGVPDAIRRRFVTATEIPAEQHLRVQQACQRHVDNAVAKTINLPGDARVEDVAAAYTAAWRLGLKGVTVYRYGSTAEQVLTLGAGEEPADHEYFTRCDPAACRL